MKILQEDGDLTLPRRGGMIVLFQYNLFSVLNLIHSNPKSSLHIWDLHCKNVSIKVNFQENYQNIPKKDTFIWDAY